MAFHSIEPERRTLHGKFSRERAPILTIDSGDTVRYRTLDAGWGLAPPPQAGAANEKFEPRTEDDRGHALCGPVFIRGAQPGMTLEIAIGTLRPGTWGWNGAGGDWLLPLNELLGVKDTEYALLWRIDPDALIAENQHGHRVSLRPFMGVMGMPPDEPGMHSTAPPRVTGGNIDCKELVAGTRLFLPIAVEGGLFSVGDGHGVQADGEASGTAIECPMERCDLTFYLHESLHIKTPRAWTPEAWLTFGFDPDLYTATAYALDAMLDLMGELHGLDRGAALALSSLAVDVGVKEIGNGANGVHARLAHGAHLV